MLLLARVSAWYRAQNSGSLARPTPPKSPARPSGRRISWAMALLMPLTFSKFFYLASLTNYYTFFLIASSKSRWKAPKCICSPSSTLAAVCT